MLRGRPGGFDQPYLGIPHRLDRPASGAIVFGTRRRATHRLGREFEARSVKKTYWACVEGRPDPPAGTWKDCLIKVYGRPQAEVVPPEHPDGRPAVLHYRTLALAERGAGWRLSWRPGGRTKSAFRPLPEAIRCGAIFSTGPRLPLVRNMTTSPASHRPARPDTGIRASDQPAARFRHRAGTALAGYPIACLALSIACGFAPVAGRIGVAELGESFRSILEPLMHDPFHARDTFESGAGRVGIYRLSKLEEAGLTEIAALPYSIRVLLECVLPTATATR